MDCRFAMVQFVKEMSFKKACEQNITTQQLVNALMCTVSLQNLTGILDKNENLVEACGYIYGKVDITVVDPAKKPNQTDAVFRTLQKPNAESRTCIDKEATRSIATTIETVVEPNRVKSETLISIIAPKTNPVRRICCFKLDQGESTADVVRCELKGNQQIQDFLNEDNAVECPDLRCGHSYLLNDSTKVLGPVVSCSYISRKWGGMIAIKGKRGSDARLEDIICFKSHEENYVIGILFGTAASDEEDVIHLVLPFHADDKSIRGTFDVALFLPSDKI